MTSIQQMIDRCSGLINTRDASEWENSFLKSITDYVKATGSTEGLSSRQVEVVERIYTKHFAG